MKKPYVVEYSTENEAYKEADRMSLILLVFFSFLALAALFK
ncbi:hypothetical protein pEaSNUABM56_00002 [Erwinia phage pEa_SNUABM_56]|uniref:Uncharacterized protein n=1 Tax=Erwinia phage pEp_SNUABM_01 TaxID=2601643 RepID=A0A5J6DAY3_9CAUD|nr:hypothetical protein HWC63_gp126 [Erwinia phage pEp_SNUABM_01]QEQ95052.1 hypothetical protein pEpSNUABM01_226 [Erwinia phage pEp_SNUABM_01]UYL84980.1 hypothetical protein pEaSNUABM55_00207 [Erwinia phage pEa_SNUABM_55]UYL85047.1 hypothetical protein pEaSNUABM56_00002 [Erwinia phage pEa_SNUABM_56]